MPDPKPTQEELETDFRRTLEDVVDLAERLGQHCRTIEQLVAVARVGIENDDQLKFLMSIATEGKSNRMKIAAG